jgi:L-threonylcarbamoyladenylate synthase
VETDTVLGIIGLNSNLIYTIKKRSRVKKLVHFVSSINEIVGLTPHEAKIISPYLPGGLTVIKHGIGYRVPNHPKLLELIKKVGWVYSSSANISGHTPIYDTREAIQIFKKHNFNLIIVQGTQQSEAPSTIINLDRKKVLRVGVIDPSPIIEALKQK